MTASVLTSQHPFMNQGAYGSPAAPLFTAMPPYMADYYSGAGLGAADPYAAAAAAGSLFGTPPQQAATAGPSGPAAAGYLYQSPSSQSAGGGLSGGGGVPGDDIRTVFISGLPHDVKERELHNLLRFMPGYEASQMNWKTGGPQGFALFSSAAHARAMVDILSGLSFDDGVLLRAEMAHKNMFIKPEDPSVKRASKHSPTALMAPPTLLSPLQLPPAGLTPNPLSPGGPAFLAAAAAAAAAAGSPTAMHLPGVLGPLRPATFSPVTNLRDNPPCNTLFIGNLGDNTSEQELRVLMGSQPGYRQLKMVRGTKSTTAFVEFVDMTSAIMVHDSLQGAVLASSDRGGIRIQYSKNPFGRREPGSSSPGYASGAIPIGSPVGVGPDLHHPLAASLGGPGGAGMAHNGNSPRALSSHTGAGGGLLSSLNGSAASSVGPAMVGGSIGGGQMLVGPAGIDQILGGGDV